MYAFFYFWKMPFISPNTCEGVMLATELAQRRLQCPANYEQMARVLPHIFLEDKKPGLTTLSTDGNKMEG